MPLCLGFVWELVLLCFVDRSVSGPLDKVSDLTFFHYDKINLPSSDELSRRTRFVDDSGASPNSSTGWLLVGVPNPVKFLNIPKKLEESVRIVGKRVVDMVFSVRTSVLVDGGVGRVVRDPSRFRLREPCDDVDDVGDVGEVEGGEEFEEFEEGDEEDEGAGEG